MTSSQDKSQELEERTISFSSAVIRLTQKYKNERILQPVFKQLVRSATSIGANYAEANNASSKADFRNKIFISKKEAAETRYWIRLVKEAFPDDVDAESLLDEVSQLLFIFQKVISTMKNGK